MLLRWGRSCKSCNARLWFFYAKTLYEMLRKDKAGKHVDQPEMWCTQHWVDIQLELFSTKKVDFVLLICAWPCRSCSARLWFVNADRLNTQFWTDKAGKHVYLSNMWRWQLWVDIQLELFSTKQLMLCCLVKLDFVDHVMQGYDLPTQTHCTKCLEHTKEENMYIFL